MNSDKRKQWLKEHNEVWVLLALAVAIAGASALKGAIHNPTTPYEFEVVFVGTMIGVTASMATAYKTIEFDWGESD